MEIQEVMGVTTIESLNYSQRQTQGEDDKQDDEEEENTNIDENKEKNEDEEQGMEMGGGANKEDIKSIKKGFSKEQDDVDTNELDYEKGQEKEKAEDKGIKTLTEVRGADNGGEIRGMENKGKERLNRGVKARKGGIDIEQVLKKQKIRRGELKERLEKRKAEMGLLHGLDEGYLSLETEIIYLPPPCREKPFYRVEE
ncbi:unnamed protein product [Leuciscus chuanchicus]